MNWKFVCIVDDFVFEFGIVVWIEDGFVVVFYLLYWLLVLFVISYIDLFSGVNVLVRGIIGDLKGELVVVLLLYK